MKSFHGPRRKVTWALDKPTWVGKGGEGLAGGTEVTQRRGGKYEHLFRVVTDYEMSTYYVLYYFLYLCTP